MCSTCHRIVVDVWHTVVFRHAYRVVVIVWMVSIGLLMLAEFERASLVFLQLSHFQHPPGQICFECVQWSHFLDFEQMQSLCLVRTDIILLIPLSTCLVLFCRDG